MGHPKNVFKSSRDNQHTRIGPRQIEQLFAMTTAGAELILARARIVTDLDSSGAKHCARSESERISFVHFKCSIRLLSLTDDSISALKS